ncbi:hypothetical protein B0J11DRAFT_556211 [Dendryphion nanum]|uniref:Flavin-containing monooxygenase n=1 Tax=Dendryphion nanum TaxID=256645 RepID=A0A9P9EDC0_9PLEO|nr:hypothetical protein B0J11DRAFT_556211 [Dendryphion nanum]
MISLRARTIAIIGGGPSGIVAAKYLRAEKAFDKIVVFEQRSVPGGIWNYTADQKDEDLFTIPQTNAKGKHQNPLWLDQQSSGLNGESDGQKRPKATASFLSPVYQNLETNIPRGLMGFQDLDWPQDSQLFPKHETVLRYITDYGKEIQDLVQYETQVINVEAADHNVGGKWTVTTRNLRDHGSNNFKSEVFDAVIVANGHFIVPSLPDIPNVKEWNAKYPGVITHSKYFRKPEDFAGKKVVVIGNSASGVDISNQIVSVCQQPLLWSFRSASMMKPPADARKTDFPPIARFLPDTRGVEFEDGRVETDIDAVIFATGYFYSLPFLEKVEPELIGDGSRVQNTYQHIFYAPRPTLSFLVLNQRVIPFPMAEAQSSVIARVYSGRLSLPPYTEMRQWEEEAQIENGSGKTFHLLPFPRDANFINEMSTWALTAERKEGLDNEGKGKIPPVWGEWEFWCRENFPAIRAAFGKRGAERHGIRTLEEVGFNFEEHVRRKDKEEGKLI